MAKRKAFVMHVRFGFGFGLGSIDHLSKIKICDGLGVIYLGAFFPLDFPLGLDPFPLPVFPLDAS